MIGGGRCGLTLARGLVGEGHAVRAVTRREQRRAELEAAGCECWIGDPDRIGTLRYALDNVTLLMWLLGPVDSAELHGPRLAMMLERAVDTTVRGVVYELGLDSGIAEVRRARATNEIPYALLDADRSDERAWVAAARSAIDDVLVPRRPRPASPAR